MMPDVEAMLTDIAQWLPESVTIEIGFDTDPASFFVTIEDETWRFPELRDCLIGAWTHWDWKRAN